MLIRINDLLFLHVIDAIKKSKCLILLLFGGKFIP